MVRTLNRLTARAIETLPSGKHGDGGGLYLVVTQRPGEARTMGRKWSFIYTSPARKRREMGLGAAGKGGVSLAEARSLAARAREQLTNGIDPLEARDADRAARIAEERAKERVKTITFSRWAVSYSPSLGQFPG